MSANVEEIKKQVQMLPPQDKMKLRLWLETETAREDEHERREHLMRKMEAEGLIRRAKRNTPLSPFRPVTVKGEPVSETIIRERG